MRPYYFLIITTIILTYVIGRYTISFRQKPSFSSDDLIEINYLKKSFQKKVSPAGIINFTDLYPYPKQLSLLDPVHLMAKDGVEKKKIFHSNSGCFKRFKRQMSPALKGKAWIWEEYRCKKRRRLPDGFFQSAPFVHPSGQSYAYLAMMLGKGIYSEKEWLIGHMSFFHVLELKKLEDLIQGLIGPFKGISKFDSKTLRDIVNGKGTILSSDFLLAKISYPQIFSILEYRIYYRSDLNEFLKKSPYRVVENSKEKRCLYRDGEICWDYNIDHLMNQMSEKTLIIFFGLIFIVVVLVRLIFIKLKEQRKDDERRRLALSVLSHEFRTPIASLILLVEQMGRNCDEMTDCEQEQFLRLSSEVYRLQRLAEKSRNYLKVQNKDNLLEFNYERVSSVKDFFYDLTLNYSDEYGDDFLIEIPEDFSAPIDTYWISIVVKNLIENAFVHGVPTVTCGVYRQGNDFIIQISDKGSCQFQDFKEMSHEFVKGNKSQGTGLGLNIVSKVVKEMGGAIHFINSPTTFKLNFKNALKVKEGKHGKSSTS